MFEKRFAAVPAQVFTADGGADGSVTIPDTALFKVKQRVVVTATFQQNQELEVKRVVSPTVMILGPTTGPITAFTDLSAYSVLAGATVFANEQKRPTIDINEFERASYEEEPTVAKRVILVDEFGNKFTEDNPLPTSATFSGAISVGEVDQGEPNSNNKAWPVKVIGTGNDQLKVNADGSINVNIDSTTDKPGLQISHNEITSVVNGLETTILTVNINGQDKRLSKVEVSGDTVAHFRIKLNGTTLVNKRSWWTSFNQTFDFEDFQNGLLLENGDVLTITVEHTRPFLGSFEATAMLI